MDKLKLDGILVEGLRHCSGIDKNGIPYPNSEGIVGTIRTQRPFFEEVVPGFSKIYNGTINLDISPRIFELIGYNYEVICDWRKDGIPQTFWFVNVEIDNEEKSHKGLVYYPHPRPGKKRKRESTLELLFPFIQNLNYGDNISILYSPSHITIK